MTSIFSIKQWIATRILENPLAMMEFKVDCHANARNDDLLFLDLDFPFCHTEVSQKPKYPNEFANLH